MACQLNPNCMNFRLPGKLKFYLIDLLRGTRILQVLKELRAEQYLPAAELNALRQKKMDRLFALAQRTAKYYQPFTSYCKVPVLTKEMVRQHPEDFKNTTYKKKLIEKTTGGSTSTPFTYYNTTSSQSYIWAGLLLCWEATGYRLGDRVAFLAGSSIIKSGWQYKLFYWLMNVELLHASPLNEQVMADYVQRLQQNKTVVIYGYAYTIQGIAHHIVRHGGASFPHLKGVVCTAEKLTPAARAIINEAFGVTVYDQYGCNEAGISAFECKQGNMHLISSRCMYETLPDGTLAATDLSNEAYIMMKYSTTDLVEFGTGTCTCKRNYPIISSVIGRQSDVVVDMENNVLHASFFGIVFGKDILIKQYQIAYTNRSIELNIHSSNGDSEYFKSLYLPMMRENALFEEYKLTMNKPFIMHLNGKHKEVVDRRVEG